MPWPASPASAAAPRRSRRALLWGALVALLLVAQTLLVALTINYESTQAQDASEAVAADTAADIRRDLLGVMQNLQALTWADGTAPRWREGAAALLKGSHGLQRVEWRAPTLVVLGAVDSPYSTPLFSRLPREDLAVEAELACNAAQRNAAPVFSRSYFVPLEGGLGLEVIDLCVPVRNAGRTDGFLVGSFALPQILDAALAQRGPQDARRHEFLFVEGDGARLARAGVPRGSGVYVAERVVDLPGNPLQLRVDAAAGRPSLIPNLTTALVLGLSIALFGVVFALARDLRRRAVAERALAEALAFRKAMEDSLSTGLRARDMRGAITYVNPAFCAMVGFTPDELRQGAEPEQPLGQPQRQPPHPPHAPPHAPPDAAPDWPPYWPPELAAQYQQRQQLRLQAARESGRAAGEPRDGGHETVFVRKNGERFPVMVYEAPLVDGQGRQTGWMSAVLDLSAQRRVEDISRQQQDRLQATARLATVGEMASLLSHELNQPLSAIASYAAGSLNMLNDPDPLPDDAAAPALLKQALERIAEQAERAGRVIKSVHDFVRRREQLRETLPVDALFDAVLPLARLQARKSGTRIDLDVRPPGDGRAGEPLRRLRVRCDRTMVEQVLLNLARNGIQAMEGGDTPPAQRVLTLRARQTHARWVTVSVLDVGPGVPADAAARLFTPFFTTKAEGMGLGLSLCRTVVEQHGGALDFGPGEGGVGAEFRFTLPAPAPVENGET